MEPGLKINEIFYSIQGESLFAGKPTVFVRTATCNLRCTYCDSRYTFWKGTLRSQEEILAEVRKYDTPYVCVTGGEPLGQNGVYPLMRALLDEGKTVSLETNGSFSIERVPDAVVKIVDIKCPDSGESDAMFWKNCDLVRFPDQVKFVIASREDFDWAQDVCRKHALPGKCTVLYSPVAEKVEPKDLAEWILESAAPVTMQIQLHKEIWGVDARGV